MYKMDSRATNLQNLIATIREDTHKKNIFLSGRTTKRGGGSKTPLTTKQKNLFFFYDF